MSQLQTLLQSLPDQLSEQEARKILTEIAPVHKALETQQIQARTKSEQGQAAMTELLTKAKTLLGVDDEAGIVRVRDERYAKNAQLVREYLTRLADVQQKTEALKSVAAPQR